MEAIERDERMNILVVPSWYETDSNKIRGSFFKEQAKALARYGHKVIIAYVYLRSAKELKTTSLFKIAESMEESVKIYCYNVPSFGSMRFGNWFQKNTKAYDKLLDYIFKREKIDIIHAHSFIPAGYSMTALKGKYKKPVIVTEHFSSILTGDLSEERSHALIQTMERADRLVAVSNVLSNAMFKYMLNDTVNSVHKNITVIPNILSERFYYKESNDKKPKFQIVSVGGLIPRKRHELTVRAFHEVFKDFRADDKKIQLEIIGDGIEREHLQQLIHEYGEDKRIHLAGLKDRGYVADAMQHSDLFILPSAFETFGVVYIEALASGLPVIGTQNGGFDEIYDPEAGYIVPIDDLSALKNALNDAYYNIGKFNKRKIAEKATEKYGEKHIVGMLENLYNEVLKSD